jgi:putative tricarboxylic transport membrane protein
MDPRNLLSGLFWLGISALVVFVEPIRGNIGTFHYPGPGFMPFWSGVVLGVLSIVVILTRSKIPEGGWKVEGLWKWRKWRNGILIITSLFIYAILLPWIGYLIATFGLLTVLFGLMGRRKWWLQGLGALVTSIVTYFVFHSWLDVHLPAGILGF